MKQREFNKQLNTCRNKSKTMIDPAKVSALPEDTRTAMALFIIRNRAPVMAEFLTSQIDRSWLCSMGYLYTTKSKQTGLTFVHTCELNIR